MSKAAGSIRAFVIALAVAYFAMWFAWVATGADVSKAGVRSYVAITIIGVGIGAVTVRRGHRARGIALASACVFAGVTALLFSAFVAAWPTDG